MIDRSKIDMMNETNYIPYKDYKDLIDVLEYGSYLSLSVKMLKSFGMRISELDHIFHFDEINNLLYWYPGKNQKFSYRKEYMPTVLLDEFKAYWRRFGRIDTGTGFKLFTNLTHSTIQRRFNTNRSWYPKTWNEKKLNMRANKFEEAYSLQLKGFRKVFCSAFYYYYLDQTHDHHISSLLVQKKLRHESIFVTEYNYIQISKFVQQDIQNYINEIVFEYDRPNFQKRMLDFI